MSQRQSFLHLLSSKLTLLILLPCLLLGGIIFVDLYKAYERMNGAYDAEYNAWLTEEVLGVVHEVQKERGNTAAFIGSEGNRFREVLAHQRTVVDKALSTLESKRKDWDLSEEMLEAYRDFVEAARPAMRIRNQIDSLDIPLKEALAFYTNINKKGLHVVIMASKLTTEQLISSELFSIYNFSGTKESAGVERAVLANVLSTGTFTPQLREKHIRLVTKQEVFLYEAMEAATSELESIYKKATQGAAAKKVKQARLEVGSKDNDFNLTAADWFQWSTDRINLLREAEQASLKVISHHAVSVQQQSVVTLVINVSILISGVVVTVLILLAIRLRNGQSKRIKEGIDIALSQRDLSHNIEIISFDDLGTAANGINKLTDLFSGDLNGFSSASSDISKSTGETTQAILQTQQNLNEQQAGIQSIASATEQMNANVNSIAYAMENNSLAVANVTQESMSSQNTVCKAVDVIQLASNDMSESARAIHRLNDRVGSITEMVQLIRGIAEQTNLLALNAAIEAARAGEQGRGFAVVADEVRSLASRTQKSTEEISVVVDELQSDSQTAFNVIFQGQGNASAASEQAELIKSALDRITVQIEEVKNLTETVTQNTKEQANAIENVNVSITNIFQQVSDSVAGAENIAAAATKIERSAGDMDKEIDKYTI